MHLKQKKSQKINDKLKKIFATHHKSLIQGSARFF